MGCHFFTGDLARLNLAYHVRQKVVSRVLSIKSSKALISRLEILTVVSLLTSELSLCYILCACCGP